MKKYFYIKLLFITTFACNAQNPVYDISVPHSEKTPGSYFKDLNGNLDGYDGTYLYSNGYISFKLALKKKVLSKGYYYEDLVVGEFQFIKNGVELNNTLSNIKINYANEKINHSITGHLILKGTMWGCTECSPTEKRLRLSFADKKAHRIIGLDIRKTTVNGVSAIKVSVFDEGSTIILKEGDPAPPPPSIELGDYLMIKQ